MKIPKRPNYKKKSYPIREEQKAWLDFDLFISLIALIISIICYLTS